MGLGDQLKKAYDREFTGANRESSIVRTRHRFFSSTPPPHLASSHAVSLCEPHPLFFFLSSTSQTDLVSLGQTRTRTNADPTSFLLSSLVSFVRTSCARRVSSWAPSSSCAPAATPWPSKHNKRTLGLWGRGRKNQGGKGDASRPGAGEGRRYLGRWISPTV